MSSLRTPVPWVRLPCSFCFHWTHSFGACASLNWPLQALTFVPLLASSPLTKIGIIYTQLLLEEEIFLANDTQIRLMGSLEPEICTKMLSHSVVKIARLDDAFSKIFKLQAGQSLQPQDKKRRKGYSRRKKIKKMKSLKIYWFLSPNFHFCACPSKHVVKHDASGKKGMLSCCNLCMFE